MHGERFHSIDAFRGLAVAATLLVDHPGDPLHVFPVLRPAAWHGATAADLACPFFLFIAGMVIPFSIGRRRREGARDSALAARAVRRAILLFALGFFLNLVPAFDFSTVRIPGVLQRVALAGLAGALVYLKSRPAGRTALAAVLLAGHTALLLFVPVPGFEAGTLDPAGNLPGFVDGRLLGSHLLQSGFDPAGILGTIPAIALVLLGTLLGDWLRAGRTIVRKTLGVFSAGIPLVASGFLLAPRLPINRSLGTASFVLFAAGMALIVFGVCFVLIDALRWKAWAGPFLVLGANPLAVFVGASLHAKVLLLVKIGGATGALSVPAWLQGRIFVPLAGPVLGSLAYAVLFALFWTVLAAPLYKHRLFLKI